MGKRIELELEKLCRYCSEPLEQRPQETNGNWERRQYCDKTCAAYHVAEKRRRRK